MKSFVYPAIFLHDKEQQVIRVLFPDLGLTTDGAFVEEAFLYAKEALKAYFVYVQKYDLDFNYPPEFDKVYSQTKNNEIVMLINADVTKKDVE